MNQFCASVLCLLFVTCKHLQAFDSFLIRILQTFVVVFTPGSWGAISPTVHVRRRNLRWRHSGPARC